ncbi:MAG: response regulator [Nitrospiraceae bacterium]|jgi:DNA-binding NtrC family response regulator|nr:MAG: response regulator [Nitrospiraceae bacterium]
MSAKILVIDDEPLMLNAVRRALLKEGYIISVARNKEDLRAALKEGPFHLLITDLYLTDMTIEHVIKKVTQSSPSVKVLKMSGSFRKDQTDHFIEKPFRIAELRKKVAEMLA